ncbi:MAG: GAF domain-containing sensor histidine kinase [Pseudorhodobacter sp.]|nr:GAF domain-containing sensor histidine kinase [Pseudorhodobacter sp.]
MQDDIDKIGRSTLVPILLETVTLATGMGFAAVARVTSERWVTCRAVDKISFGLQPGDELDVESTLCHSVRLSNAEIVISNVRTDPVYCNHHTPARYGLQSYISVPIRTRDGSFFGTLCAIDPEPRNLDDENLLAMFRLFAKMIGDSLETDAKLMDAQKIVQQERQLTKTQQDFIAILAHDLRNPIAAIHSGLNLIGRSLSKSRDIEIVALMKASLGRMTNLVEDLLTQARQRQEGGIAIDYDASEPLGPVIEQIVAEMRSLAPDNTIECVVDLPYNVPCDRDRIAQMLSNLIGNAVTHGAAGRPIQVIAKIESGDFLLSVTNEGQMIPRDQIPVLFLPFQQGAGRTGKTGLGLGLYIAAEIAKAHGGTLAATSDDDKTVFTFRMPQV